MKTLTLGYSTCPNDTYIFGGLELSRAGLPLRFDPVLADVETLNTWALRARLDVTKLSFFALGQVRSHYALLNRGAALGRGCGPILAARPGTGLDSLHKGVVAAPGQWTTARLLLTLFLGREPKFQQMVFSEVMPAVCSGKALLGLVIHEGRFTLHEWGLVPLVDLGAWWEKETGLPIPLGGIGIRRDLGKGRARQVDHRIGQSLALAEQGSSKVMDYVNKHAREMAPHVVSRHINLYVNRFTRELGPEGRKAVNVLLDRAEGAGLLSSCDLPLMWGEG